MTKYHYIVLGMLIALLLTSIDSHYATKPSFVFDGLIKKAYDECTQKGQYFEMHSITVDGFGINCLDENYRLLPNINALISVHGLLNSRKTQ